MPEKARATVLDRSFPTDLVPGDCEYRVALPPGYAAERESPYPFLLVMHGGGGSRDFLSTVLPTLEEAWHAGNLDPCVAACMTAARSFYMDYRDGTESWETLMVTEFLSAVRDEFHCATERGKVAVTGVSMGGMGSLRLAFKHPHLFGTVASLEPATESSLAYESLTPVDTFYRQDMYMEKFGKDGRIDTEYWAANNPATIAATAPERLRNTAIYIEAGSEDGFELHRGTEFVHRILWDNDIKHEYRHILGADHIGKTLEGRTRYALDFIGRQWNPPPVDQEVAEFRRLIAPMRQQAGLEP